MAVTGTVLLLCECVWCTKWGMCSQRKMFHLTVCYTWLYCESKIINTSQIQGLDPMSQWRCWSHLCCVECIVSTAAEHDKCAVLESSSLALMVFCQALLTRHTVHAWSPLACRTSPWPAETGNRHTALRCGLWISPSHRWPCDYSGGATNWERVWRKDMEKKKLLWREKQCIVLETVCLN